MTHDILAIAPILIVIGPFIGMVGLLDCSGRPGSGIISIIGAAMFFVGIGLFIYGLII
jgi:hypothetical protein